MRDYTQALEATSQDEGRNFWGEIITPALRKAQAERHAQRLAAIEAMPDDEETSELEAA